jgi:hypothetical protein
MYNGLTAIHHQPPHLNQPLPTLSFLLLPIPIAQQHGLWGRLKLLELISTSDRPNYPLDGLLPLLDRLVVASAALPDYANSDSRVHANEVVAAVAAVCASYMTCFHSMKNSNPTYHPA